MQQSKIDAIVNTMIDHATNRGDGFILDLVKNADDEDGFARIEVRTAKEDPDEYQRAADARSHVIGDTESFIAYAERYGNKDKSLIFYDEDGATLTIDEEVEFGEREIISLRFVTSDEWKNLSQFLGVPTAHRNFYAGLIALSHIIADPAILLSTRTMKMNMQVSHESDLQDDDKTLGILVKSSKGEQLKKFPKRIPVRLPALDQDVIDESQWIEATLHLDIDLPTEPTGQCLFTLSCPEWKMLLRERIKREADVIKEGLAEFTIVHGHSCTFARKIGRAANQIQ